MNQRKAVRKTGLQSNRNSPSASPRSPKQRGFSGAGSPLNRRSPGLFSATGSPHGSSRTRSPSSVRNPVRARSPRTRSPAGTRSPTSGTGQLSPRRDLKVGLEDSYHRSIKSPLRKRHHSVRCVNVLIYYGIVISTFLLYSVGFIAYKLDEDPEEVKEFYRTMTTSESSTIFKIETTRHLEGDDRAVTATEGINYVAWDDTRDQQELSTSTDAVANAKEVAQWQRYIVVSSLTPKAELTSPSPPSSQAPYSYSMMHIHEVQDKLNDTFVHLLHTAAMNEKNRSSESQHETKPVGGANFSTVPFQTFPGLLQW